MKIAYFLMHGWRFAGWSPTDFLQRYHFSKTVARKVAERGHEVVLYTLHEDLRRPATVESAGYRINLYPASLRVPFASFGAEYSHPAVTHVTRFDPSVVHWHDYYLFFAPLALNCLHYNGQEIVAQYHGGNPLPGQRLLLRPTLQKLDFVLTSLTEEATRLRSSYGVSPGRIRILPHVALDEEVVKREVESTRRNEVTTILYVGRFPRPMPNLVDKRPNMLIETFAKMTRHEEGVRLVMVGDGPGLEYCKGLARRLGVRDKVVFRGYVERREVLDHYGRADVLFVPMALPSIDGRWDGSIQESLYLGTPVVAFSSSHSYEDRPHGWLVPPTAEAAKHLTRIIGDKDALMRKGSASREDMEDMFTADEVVEELLDIYGQAAQIH